jgi:hypothetical protein
MLIIECRNCLECIIYSLRKMAYSETVIEQLKLNKCFFLLCVNIDYSLLSIYVMYRHVSSIPNFL